MVLVDTSVWVSHLRETNGKLISLLNDGEVACHPFIIGELACGNLRNRSLLISLLEALPSAKEVQNREALAFIESNNLMGRGLGYIDINLLASAILTDLPLWTLDNNLAEAAAILNCRF